jgi:hypothetical protein
VFVKCALKKRGVSWSTDPLRLLPGVRTIMNVLSFDPSRDLFGIDSDS